jgi:hypothetical protein
VADSSHAICMHGRSARVRVLLGPVEACDVRVLTPYHVIASQARRKQSGCTRTIES